WERRETWLCHRRCGARYTLTGDNIFTMFVGSVRAGLAEVLVGEQ
ncbi:MAG: hypothetical protein QOJ23_2059, partial [Actinomycetota bacterium]|nr:hypothetical protein [Actinomycetota bacterium]